MTPYYKLITSTNASVLPLNQSLLSSLEKLNKEELDKLDERLAEAEKTEGESDIADALRARASYLTRIGDKVWYPLKDNVQSLLIFCVGQGHRSSEISSRKNTRIGSKDRHRPHTHSAGSLLRRPRYNFVKSHKGGRVSNSYQLLLIEYSCFLLTLTQRLVDTGGDWDRRNRLKVYRGLHLLSIRQFKRGGELLLDALSTFTATELLSYNDFVALTTIANVLTLKRVDLKKKVSCLRLSESHLLTVFLPSMLIFIGAYAN